MTFIKDRPLTLADLDEILGIPKQATHLDGYVQAAAVSSSYDPSLLKPFNSRKVPVDRVIDELLPLSEPITDGYEAGRWSLRLPERREALSQLASTSNLKGAIGKVTDRPDSPAQHMFERVALGQSIPLGEMTRENLAALFVVHEWLDGIVSDLPDLGEVRRAIARFDLLAPMRRLADQTFVGREQELAQLSAYMQGPESLAPLFVFGPGGVGKSTLLAKFILDQTESSALPFAYLDIDRSTIRPERPISLLIDATRQLGEQLNVDPQTIAAAISDAEFSGSRYEQSRSFESLGTSDSFRAIAQFTRVFVPYLSGRQVLLLVDTFEEAQYMGADVVWPLLDFLGAWSREVPGIRVVIAGRAMPTEFLTMFFQEFEAPVDAPDDEADTYAEIRLPERPIDLRVLDQESARALLTLTLNQLGLESLSTADLDDVIGIVGRNPMCVKLAARVLRDQGIEKLREARSQLLSTLKAEKVQALLYGRILHHLHSDDVRQLAYPGLVVRRIDPEVIKTVLARPCGLRLTPTRDEITLFQELAQEAALVEVDPLDNSLRHRPDVRRLMLQDLTDHVDTNVVRSINQAAVRFYSKRDDPVSRAEEIYHRLRLRQPAKQLDARWVPEAAERLKGALPELRPKQALWLAQKIGVTLDASIRDQASHQEWEDQAQRSAERFLRAGNADEALAVLRERKRRLPRSLLYALEVDALRLMGRNSEALKVARVGVEAAGKSGSLDKAVELLLAMVSIEEAAERPAKASKLLDEASGVAANITNDMLWLRIKVARIRLHRQLQPRQIKERRELRKEALNDVDADMLRRLRGYPVLLREVAAELGKDDPRIAAAAINTLGVEITTDEHAQALGKAIVELNASLDQMSKTPSPGGGSLRDRVLKKGADLFEAHSFDANVIREWVDKEGSAGQSQAISEIIKSAEPQTESLDGLRDYFRVGVKESLAGPRNRELV